MYGFFIVHPSAKRFQNGLNSLRNPLHICLRVSYMDFTFANNSKIQTTFLLYTYTLPNGVILEQPRVIQPWIVDLNLVLSGSRRLCRNVRKQSDNHEPSPKGSFNQLELNWTFWYADFLDRTEFLLMREKDVWSDYLQFKDEHEPSVIGFVE